MWRADRDAAQMRMVSKLGRRIDPRKGDVGGGELLRDLRGVERGEFGGDFSVSLGAPFHPLHVGGEGRIGGERRIVEHLLRQHAPFAIVLDADENVDTVAALERAIRRNRSVRETEALWRTYFREKLENALGRIGRGTQVAVFCLDLDRFKEVNDTLGHPVGDELLLEVAHRLRECIRDEETVARLGGDEFAIVQAGRALKLAETSALATRLIETIGAPFTIHGHQILIGATLGISIAPDDGADPDQLLKNADLALYRAKGDGRGNYQFFEAGMDARALARRTLELELRTALAKGEFELQYQPLLDIKTSTINCCEALLRWNHPPRGLVLPAEFIWLAEETGLIIPIGDWVLRRACAEATRWPQAVRVAVNVSPAQFKDRNLVYAMEETLASTGLPADRLEIEITKSGLPHLVGLSGPTNFRLN